MAQEPTKEARDHAFYEAFRAWFLESKCDFWSECDAPESLATIAVELSDRFAQERAAKAVAEPAGDVVDRARALTRDWLDDDNDLMMAALLDFAAASRAEGRREALQEAALWHDRRYVEIRDAGLPLSGAHTAAHYESAEYLRSLLSSPPAPRKEER